MIKRMAKLAYNTIPFKGRIFGLMRRFSVPEKLYRHLHFIGPFTALAREGRFKLYHFGTSTQNEIFWRGADVFEPASSGIWKKLAAGARVIVDGGANMGLYSLLAAVANPRATIVAFEPIPSVFDKLSINCALNPHFSIKPEMVALSDATGTFTIYVSRNEEHPVNSTMNSIGAVDPDVMQELPIQAVALDEYVAHNALPTIDLIKLDVEGHEPAALRGMRKTLTEHRPIVLSEIWNSDVGRDVLSALPPDYALFRIDEREFTRVEELNPPIGVWGTNYIFCPPEKVALL